LWEEKDMRAQDRIADEKKKFRKSGIMNKLMSLQNARRKAGRQTKKLVRPTLVPSHAYRI